MGLRHPVFFSSILSRYLAFSIFTFDLFPIRAQLFVPLPLLLSVCCCSVTRQCISAV